MDKFINGWKIKSFNKKNGLGICYKKKKIGGFQIIQQYYP